VLLALALVVGLATAAPAVIVCESRDGTPPDETVVHVEIEAPAPGTVFPAAGACSLVVPITGTYYIQAPPTDFDIYIVIDMSGSTSNDSGADVNENGIFGEPADNIYQAEVAAAQNYVRGLDPAHARAAVISFNGTATLRHELSADLASVDAALEAMKMLSPGGGTAYLQAMRMVESEMNTRGDRVNRRQRVVFLSDGQPNEGFDEIHRESLRHADLGLVYDTFALGFTSSASLEDMAITTGGRFTYLPTPGDILGLLPDFVLDVPYAFDHVEDLAGTSGPVDHDPVTGTFEAQATLMPGTNIVTLYLRTDSEPPMRVECAIDLFLDAGLTADAGPDRSACPGEPVLLDASASGVTCPNRQYRWVDCLGVEVCPPSGDPTCLAAGSGTCSPYILEVTCVGEPCVATDMVNILPSPPPDALPAAVPACDLSAQLSCGTPQAGTTYAWDTDLAVDSDGDGSPANDVDLIGCDVRATWPSGSAHDVRLVATFDGSTCASFADLAVPLLPGPVVAPASVTGCARTAQLSCGAPDPGTTYTWDTDLAVDSDGDGSPGNDADATGCDVSAVWPDSGDRGVRVTARDGSGCLAGADLTVPVLADPIAAPSAVVGCAFSAQLSCGTAEAGVSYAWDVDVATDSDGDGDPTNDVDATGCDVPASWPSAGARTARLVATHDDRGCVTAGDVAVDIDEPAALRDIDGGACPGVTVDLSCGTPDPGATYWWDLDASVDADGDGDPANDVDATGCDVMASWPAGGTYEVRGWTRDARGCVAPTTAGLLAIVDDMPPGEVPDLRLRRSSDAVTLSWGSVPAAARYRLVRGTLDFMWSNDDYDHVADPAVGAGACDVTGLREVADPDDAATPDGWYYLVLAAAECSGDGGTGFGWDGRARFPRPGRIVSAGCP
jgi:hypothetical protein